MNGSDGSALPVAHPLDELLRLAWPTRLEDSPGGSNGEASRIVCLPATDHRHGFGLAHGVSTCGPARYLSQPVGDPIATFVRDGTETNAVLDESSGNVVVPFSLLEAHTLYVLEGWRDGEPERGLSERKLAAF